MSPVIQICMRPVKLSRCGHSCLWHKESDESLLHGLPQKNNWNMACQRNASGTRMQTLKTFQNIHTSAAQGMWNHANQIWTNLEDICAHNLWNGVEVTMGLPCCCSTSQALLCSSKGAPVSPDTYWDLLKGSAKLQSISGWLIPKQSNSKSLGGLRRLSQVSRGPTHSSRSDCIVAVVAAYVSKLCN